MTNQSQHTPATWQQRARDAIRIMQAVPTWRDAVRQLISCGLAEDELEADELMQEAEHLLSRA